MEICLTTTAPKIVINNIIQLHSVLFLTLWQTKNPALQMIFAIHVCHQSKITSSPGKQSILSEDWLFPWRWLPFTTRLMLY